jgi:plastocyanin
MEAIFESDGAAVTVTLSAAVVKNQVAVVQGWVGITAAAGANGETIALVTTPREYQFTVPAALAVSKGDVVYLDVTDVTGHTPDSTALYTAAGSNRIRLFKATRAKDANNIVTGILLGN